MTHLFLNKMYTWLVPLSIVSNLAFTGLFSVICYNNMMLYVLLNIYSIKYFIILSMLLFGLVASPLL